MRNVLLLVMLALGCLTQAYAQDEKKGRLEEITEKSGVLLKKEYYRMGTVHKIKIDVVSITNLSSGEVTKLVVLESAFFISVNNIVTKIGTLDKTELDGVVAGMNAIVQESGKAQGDYVEITFTSRSEEVRVIGYKKGERWEYGVRLGDFLPETAFMDAKSFLELAVVLRNCKDRM